MSKLTEIRNQAVTLEIGGESRELKYDMNAFAEMENKYGSIDAALGSLDKGKMTDVRNILWLGLIHDQAVIDEETGDVAKYNLTPYQVGSWISDIGMLNGIVEKVAEALSAGMPTPTEAELVEAKAMSELKNQ